MARRPLYTIFILACIVKLTVVFYPGLVGQKGPEVFEYEAIADNILNGRGFVYNFYGIDHKAFVQPFYPVFTAIVYHLTNHSQAVVLAVQSIVSSALCFVIYSIAVKLTERPQALLAAALVAFHPGLAAYSILKLHTLVFDVFFYMLAVSAILRFIKNPNVKNAFFTGSLMGLALLTRSTILLFMIFSFIFIFFVLRGMDVKRRMRYVFIICLFTVLTYSPWVIRNYRAFGEFVFMQTGSGENLWAGNNRLASGSAILASGKSVHTLMPEKMRRDLLGLDELSQDRYFKNCFLNFIKDEPLLFIGLLMKKLYHFWWFSPHAGTLYPKLWLNLYKPYYVILFFLFIVGVATALKTKANSPAMAIIIAYMLSLAFLHAIVNVDTRHRWTIEPVMLIFSSIGFFRIGRGLWMKG